MSTSDQIMYETIYRISRPRWDDGQIPPQVTQLVSCKGNSGNAIDLGCGTGTHSIYLAQQGFTVTGIDISPTAIRRANEKASRAEVKVEFIVQDVAHLDFLPGPYDIALDVGCFHGLSAANQQGYALALTRLMQTGSTLLVWGVDPQPIGFGVTAEGMERIFASGFKLERIENVQFHQRPSKWYWLKKR